MVGVSEQKSRVKEHSIGKEIAKIVEVSLPIYFSP
jgi:hypothetical protein